MRENGRKCTFCCAYFVTAVLDHVLCRVKMVASQMTVNMNLDTKLGSVYSYSVQDYRERVRIL